MQSVFRSIPSMPWSANVTLNKTVAPFVAHADLSVAGNATNGKRKRNVDSSPRSSPVPAPKKIKSAAADAGGAVRTAPKQYIRGADGKVGPKNVVMSVIAPKPVDVVQYSAGSLVQTLGPTDLTRRASPSTFWQSSVYGPVQQPLSQSSDKSAISTATRDGSRASNIAITSASASSNISAATPVASSPSAFAPTSLATRQGNAGNAAAEARSSTSDSTNDDKEVKNEMPVASTPSTAHSSQVEHDTSVVNQHNAPESKAKVVSKADVNMDHVRAICELEINQAILTKHNELRLIDQEIAKCQIALEQIRRCELVPFPAMQGFSVEVATHSGPSLLAPAGHVAAPYPAPWGVTDGPYTQHYAPWLIQSAQFDPRLPLSSTPLASPFSRDGRLTRTVLPDSAPLSATFQSARAARASVGRGRHSLDGHSSQPQRDPLVIKRNQDNQWVKLYCTNCKPERSDFANVQGFLNHCRISHKLDYKSHEAAAIACGRVVQLNETQLPPEPVSAREPVAKSSFSAPVAVDPTMRPAVHAFISGPIKGRENKHQLQQLLPRASSQTDRSATGLSTPVTPTVQPGFKSSTSTPHLSQLMAKSGFVGDFAAHVESAKRKEDLSMYDDSESEAEAVNAKKIKLNKKKGIATPVSGVKIKLKPGPKPGKRTNGGFTTPSLASSAQFSPQTSFPLDSPSSDGSTVATPNMDLSLSPHAADSNPGLVSDRDDDDDEMEYEEITPADVVERSSGAEMLVKIEDSDGEIGHADETQRICAVAGTTTC